MAEIERFTGTCHDCGKPVTVTTHEIEGDPDRMRVSGGALYLPESQPPGDYLKCDDCHKADPVLRRYQRTEVYSRIVGYLRPVSQWNDGKVNEFNDRKIFKVPDEAA